MRTQLLLLGLLLVPFAASGTESGAASAAEGGSSAKLLSSRPADYPDAEKRAGHGGIVVLAYRVGAAGVPEDLRVKTSSGFAALDAAALESARQWKYAPAKDAAGNVVVAEFEQKVEFNATEGPMDFLTQPCGKVVAEVAALRATRPKAQLAVTKTFGRTGAFVTSRTMGLPPAESIPIIDRLPAFYEAIYADCQHSPGTIYETVMKRHIGMLGLKRGNRAQ